MIPVHFHDAARSELAEEVLYYAEIDRRLGERLAQAVERAVALAAEFPDMGLPTNSERGAFSQSAFRSLWSICIGVAKSSSSP